MVGVLPLRLGTVYTGVLTIVELNMQMKRSLSHVYNPHATFRYTWVSSATYARRVEWLQCVLILHPYLFANILFPSNYFQPSQLSNTLNSVPPRMNDTENKVVISAHDIGDFESEAAAQTAIAPLKTQLGDLYKHRFPETEPKVEVYSDAFVVDKAMERRLKWKCDFKLLPPLIVLFVITFLDRSNIANAKIEGMTTDLHMVGNDYNMSLWILNIPYIVLAVPSNMLMKTGFVKPSVYLSGIMFCWGQYNGNSSILETNHIYSRVHDWARRHKVVPRCSCMQILNGSFRSWLRSR